MGPIVLSTPFLLAVSCQVLRLVCVHVRARVRVHVHVYVYMCVCVCLCVRVCARGVCGAHGVPCAQGESRPKASFTESHRCHVHSGKLDLGRLERGTYTRHRKRLTCASAGTEFAIPIAIRSSA